MLTTVAVENYRSIRHLRVPLGRLTVITGANGAGKSNLYRALRLLAACGGDGVVAALAAEGGVRSALWAGDRSAGAKTHEPVAIRLGFADDPLSYCVDLGLPVPGSTPFDLDPLIKRECIWSGPLLKPATMLVDRGNALARTRTDRGWEELSRGLGGRDSILGELADPERAPEVLRLRQQIRRWRFYDHVRTDPAAPAHQPAIATTTPVLPADGAGLPAALKTIAWPDGGGALRQAVDKAFPGTRLEIVDRDGWVDLELRQPRLLRPLTARELSDGTLRYLLWVAALLTTHPPELLVLNEPETSLHTDLIRPLAELVTAATSTSQVIVVTHSATLVDALLASGEPDLLTLVKDGDETRLDGQGRLDEPPWRWPTR